MAVNHKPERAAEEPTPIQRAHWLLLRAELLAAGQQFDNTGNPMDAPAGPPRLDDARIYIGLAEGWLQLEAAMHACPALNHEHPEGEQEHGN